MLLFSDLIRFRRLDIVGLALNIYRASYPVTLFLGWDDYRGVSTLPTSFKSLSVISSDGAY